MQVRYLTINSAGQLTFVSTEQVQALWNNEIGAAELDAGGPNEIRLVSVLWDAKLRPRKLYLLRLPLSEGRFTHHSYLTLRIYAEPSCVTAQEMFQHHSEGWPTDFFQQLAVALDVPVKKLNVPLGIGGPLLKAAALKVTPKQAVRYLRGA